MLSRLHCGSNGSVVVSMMPNLLHYRRFAKYDVRVVSLKGTNITSPAGYFTPFTYLPTCANCCASDVKWHGNR